ncbi:MAG: terminase family protein, partial [Alphaproteobacteria bacterium]|nr:terminase family protein [Alphaproteobacteria bacterium]
TGQYPDWWEGYRFTKPIVMLTGSESYELTRDGVQRLLVGSPEQEEMWGTGFIPHASIMATDRRSGVPNALENISVAHVSGGNSVCQFKAYEQGRGKWQASTVDYVWPDEEPPEDVYFEALTRTNATQGLVAVTFTPLKGISNVVGRYLMEKSPDRHVTTMTIDDAEHYTPEQRQKIIDSYPPHEREARTKGIPSLGSGRIFPIEEDAIICEPIELPKEWAVLGAMDFGWDHPFAAVKLYHDREADCIYVASEYRQREASPIIHAAALRPWGEKLEFAWPHDGLQHDKGSGDQLAELYRGQGLDLLPEKATFEDGTNGVEAGLMDMLDRMKTNRWKVFRTCGGWLEEFRLYHRKDGKIVKERDDLISASRYGLMMLRFARNSIDRKSRNAGYQGEGSWMG